MKKFSYDGLNEAQKKAVAINDGPVLVSAGAGTGKTSVLTKRVSRLILDGVARPEQILAITFTNKATREMKERIESTCGHNGSGVLVSTFHSFCVKVLREFISYLKPTIDGKYAYNKFFTICDDDDRKKIIKKVVKEHFGETDKEIEKQLNWAISTAKNEGITPSEYLEQVRSEPFKDFVKMYAAYEEHLEKSNSLDFDDLIIKTLKLLNQ
ncbi:MAG: UvrD-helicase domain-containing protein, partial [Firmicutes bacterium]|nr:UvrD-helicase domain-containing protein [Bacillota bacterium]